MPGNGKVFISHTHEDNERCAPLLRALDTWGVDYWFDAERMPAGSDLTITLQEAIAARDIFIRICTAAAQHSYWVRLETGAFRSLQAEAHRRGHDDERIIINLILDPNYQREPFDYATMFIDATDRSEQQWQAELRRAIGVPPALAVAPPPTPVTADADTAPSAATGGHGAAPDGPLLGLVTRLRTVPARRLALVGVAALLVVALAGVALASHGEWPFAAARANNAPPTTPTPTWTPFPTGTPIPLWVIASAHYSVPHLPDWKMMADVNGVKFLLPGGDPATYVYITLATGTYSQDSDGQLVSPDAANHFLGDLGDFADIQAVSATVPWIVSTWSGARAEYTYFPTPDDPPKGIRNHVAILAIHYKGNAQGPVYVVTMIAPDSNWTLADQQFEPFIRDFAFTT